MVTGDGARGPPAKEVRPPVMALTRSELAIWLYLLAARGGFWLCRERDGWEASVSSPFPRVAALVPARNEAITIGESIGSLLRQHYTGPWMVILVGDDSSHGTPAAARRTARGSHRRRVA